MPGFLENVNIVIDGTTSWEINTNKQLPHVIDVAISFKPIYDTLPKRSTVKSATPIIGSNNFYSNLSDGGTVSTAIEKLENPSSTIKK
jgi:hypothetical protein